MAELESISTAQLIRLCKQKSEETQKQKLQLYGCPTVVFTYMRITGDLPIIQLSSLTCVNKYADTYLLKWVVTPLISKPTVKPSHLTVDYLILHVRGRQKAIS